MIPGCISLSGNKFNLTPFTTEGTKCFYKIKKYVTYEYFPYPIKCMCMCFYHPSVRAIFQNKTIFKYL